MSVTTTENSVYYRTVQVLRDYELHHTGEDGDTASVDSSLNEHREETTNANPPFWPTNARRIPQHRPINTNLDFSERGVRNRAEGVFVHIMLSGVFIVAGVAQIWHVTGGRVNDKIFRYKIGGEW